MAARLLSAQWFGRHPGKTPQGVDALFWTAHEGFCYGCVWGYDYDWWSTVGSEALECGRENVHDWGVILVEGSVETNYV